MTCLLPIDKYTRTNQFRRNWIENAMFSNEYQFENRICIIMSWEFLNELVNSRRNVSRKTKNLANCAANCTYIYFCVQIDMARHLIIIFGTQTPLSASVREGVGPHQSVVICCKGPKVLNSTLSAFIVRCNVENVWMCQHVVTTHIIRIDWIYFSPLFVCRLRHRNWGILCKPHGSYVKRPMLFLSRSLSLLCISRHSEMWCMPVSK